MRLPLRSLVGLACAACMSNAGELGTDELIGGREAQPEEFPSTLNILGSCTAAKVGPRQILTAAHCAVSRHKPTRLWAGKSIRVTTENVLPAERDAAIAASRSVVLERVLIHPAWTRGGGNVPRATSPVPDVAVLVLTEASAAAIADIPDARIDRSRVVPGDPLVVMGYGCETGTQAPPEQTGRLKLQEVRALSTEQALAENVRPIPHPGVNLPGSYFFTPGASLDPAAASICPGDSGGPVYRAGAIVGVNAYYNFLRDDAVGVSFSNWHTRLDDDAIEGVGRWVADAVAGVDVPSGEPACPGPVPDDAFFQFEEWANWKPPVATPGACSARDIDEIGTILDEGAIAALAGGTRIPETCRRCAVSLESDTTHWQPLRANISAEQLFDNLGACYAHLEGRPECGKSFVKASLCPWEACIQCPLSAEAWERCSASSTTGACAPAEAAFTQDCPTRASTASRCQTVLDAIRVVCGSP